MAELDHDVHELQHAKQCNDAANGKPPKPQPKKGSKEYKKWEKDAKDETEKMRGEIGDACKDVCPDF